MSNIVVVLCIIRSQDEGILSHQVATDPLTVHAVAATQFLFPTITPVNIAQEHPTQIMTNVVLLGLTLLSH